MKKLTLVSIFAAALGVMASSEARAAIVQVDEVELAKHFTPEEIARYKALMAGKTTVDTSTSDEQNRLADETRNRCGDDELPVDDCPPAQDLAWNGGNGCINATEYVYAQKNAIAPLCNPVRPQVFAGWCRCGCFEKSTELYAMDSVIGRAQMARVDTITTDWQVLAMKDTGTVDVPEFAPRPITATTVGSETKPLVWVNLDNGRSLGLTEQHAVLLSTGEMIPAHALDASTHQLVSRWGEFVGIHSIERIATPDPVYNVLTDAKLDHLGHIIVANDMIVGDIMWQNTLAVDLWKVIVRM